MVGPKNNGIAGAAAPSRGRFTNTGNGPTFQIIDIDHPEYMAVIDPDTAFWSLVRREKLANVLSGDLPKAYAKKTKQFAVEMNGLRFGLTPSAVYFNPTERCNMNCTYCYIPEKMRREGEHMPVEKLLAALEILKQYFRKSMPKGSMPQIIFHGAEPLLNRDAVFTGIEEYKNDFLFGIQTNATLLDDAAVEFLTSHHVSIGLSLDAPTAKIADRTRKNWDGQGAFKQVTSAMRRLNGYEGWSIICTITSANLRHLTGLVDFFHEQEVPTCLMNILRCTLSPSRSLKPGDTEAAKYFLSALDRTYELYQQTGRRLPVGNFANILLAIIAPAARRLMCDISPCGGGRCFFALAPNGDMFPCSEFIGLDRFRAGNLFTDDISAVHESEPFRLVTGRKVENIEPCRRCAIRHFCGSPCPAEAYEMNGDMNKTGAFCEFYEEQVRYAFRIIADGKVDAYLWDDWDKGMKNTFNIVGG
ncbi:MAG: peptide-modifying radical SAM enzyme CbpB [Deltaproteobacteria bacterium]|nr:peptide-modifying radical SAM enzyme CbpB [Deltaproteobacteria bacterium]